MKIYVNSQHEIKALRINDTGNNALTEIDVPDDFLQGYCDTVIKSFCHKICTDEGGHIQESTYPYKDFSMLECIQEQDNLRVNLENEHESINEYNIELDYQLSLIKLGL